MKAFNTSQIEPRKVKFAPIFFNDKNAPFPLFFLSSHHLFPLSLFSQISCSSLPHSLSSQCLLHLFSFLGWVGVVGLRGELDLPEIILEYLTVGSFLTSPLTWSWRIPIGLIPVGKQLVSFPYEYNNQRAAFGFHFWGKKMLGPFAKDDSKNDDIFQWNPKLFFSRDYRAKSQARPPFFFICEDAVHPATINMLCVGSI